MNQVCDACLVGETDKDDIPQKSKFHVIDHMELVHGDICRPIDPATPDGNCSSL
jgi:hypothetical protein